MKQDTSKTTAKKALKFKVTLLEDQSVNGAGGSGCGGSGSGSGSSVGPVS